MDFGNTEWVDDSDVRLIEKQFLRLPFYTLKCSLPLIPLENSWEEDAKYGWVGWVCCSNVRHCADV